MDKKPPDRTSLEQYFRYQTMIDRPVWGWILPIAQTVVLILALWQFLRTKLPVSPDNLLTVILNGLLIACAVMAASAILKFVGLQLHKRLARRHRRAKLSRLEAASKEVLKHDYQRAMKQMVRQAGLKPAHLREIGSVWHDKLEQQLFSEEDLRRFLGRMANQSLRMATPYGTEPAFAATASDRLKGQGPFSAYFSPVRLICLFFTNTEIVLGDSIFDSRTGEMVTRVRRLADTSFRELQTIRKTTRHSISSQQLRAWLSEHPFTPQEEKAIALVLERYERNSQRKDRKHQGKAESPYVLSRLARYLVLDRETDTPLILPMSYQYALVRGKGLKFRLPANTPFPLAAEARARRETPPERLTGSAGKPGKGGHFLEYRTRWTLLAELVGTGLAAAIAYAGLMAIAVQAEQQKSSTEIIDIDVERNGLDGPRRLD